METSYEDADVLRVLRQSLGIEIRHSYGEVKVTLTLDGHAIASDTVTIEQESHR